MCETLHLIPSIKMERRKKRRKEEKGEGRGEGSREEGQKKRRREKGGGWGKEEDRGEGKKGRGKICEQFLVEWDTRIALQGLMPMLHLKYRPFVLEFSSACHYVYRDFDSYKKKYKKYLNVMERESLFVASAQNMWRNFFIDIHKTNIKPSAPCLPDP